MFGIVVCPLVDVVHHVVVGLFEFHDDGYDGLEHFGVLVFVFCVGSFAFVRESVAADDETEELFVAFIAFVFACVESFPV